MHDIMLLLIKKGFEINRKSVNYGITSLKTISDCDIRLFNVYNNICSNIELAKTLSPEEIFSHIIECSSNIDKNLPEKILYKKSFIESIKEERSRKNNELPDFQTR